MALLQGFSHLTLGWALGDFSLVLNIDFLRQCISHLYIAQQSRSLVHYKREKLSGNLLLSEKYIPYKIHVKFCKTQANCPNYYTFEKKIEKKDDSR